MLHKLPAETLHILTVAGVVIFGAIVHATAQLKISRDKNQEFDIADFVILTVIASFSGMIFGLASTLVWQNVVIVILNSAIGAFLGMAGLNKLAAIMLNVLSSNLDKK